MKVYGRCSSCNKQFSIYTKSRKRAHFAMNNGEVHRSSCVNCGVTNMVHVDNLKAKPAEMTFIY